MSTDRPKLHEIATGSDVRIEDTMHAVPTFEGTVVGSVAEFGPSAVPAAYIKPKGGGEPVVVTDTGKWKVTVLVDATILGQLATTPARMVHVRPKVGSRQAAQFLGGSDAALEIIKWAGGRAAIRWVQPTSQEPEHLTVSTPDGDMYAWIGDWVMCGARGEFTVVTSDSFPEDYDIISAAEADPEVNTLERTQKAQRERAALQAQAQSAILQAQSVVTPRG